MTQVENVRKLQQMLNSCLRPSPGLSADGIMGPKTRAALARYNQAKSHLGEENNCRLIVANGDLASKAGDAEAGSSAWMSIAEAELGTAELPGVAHNQRIIAYHAATSLAAQTDEVPWCASFINWVMREAGFAGTNSALANSWSRWGMACTAKFGAITVIKRKNATSDAATGSSTGFHVGFLVEKTATRVRLLGGNQGDMVKLSNFSLSGYEVRAYRWPQ
jgi:uncharacterized protein (TIGR02594 family)